MFCKKVQAHPLPYSKTTLFAFSSLPINLWGQADGFSRSRGHLGIYNIGVVFVLIREGVGAFMRYKRAFKVVAGHDIIADCGVEYFR